MEEITVQEVARRLGKNERTIRRWVHTDRIPYRVGDDGRLLFQASDIERMRSEQPPSPTIDDALALIHALEARIEALEQALARLTSPMPSTVPRQVKPAKPNYSAKATVSDELVSLGSFAERHKIPSTYKAHTEELGAILGKGNKYYLDRSGQAKFYQLFHTHDRFERCAECPHTTT